ncbi:hypothetical protein J7L05_09900 [bacterium]|nr:hypothetical protein [bacterium]
MADKENIDENELVDERLARKEVDFIKLSVIIPEERIVKESFKKDSKFDNIEKIQFKCQPLLKDDYLTSLDGLESKSPIKEIMYRILVNNKRAMKLGDIVTKTFEIMKNRRPTFVTIDQDTHREFYRVLKEDTYYGFTEVE